MSEKPQYGPWTKCAKCGRTAVDWFPPDENGVRETVKLKEITYDGKRYVVCQRHDPT